MNPGHGEQHRWLLAGLLKMGYTWQCASTIATRTLMGHTLFPNEAEDAAKVLAELNQGFSNLGSAVDSISQSLRTMDARMKQYDEKEKQ